VRSIWDLVGRLDLRLYYAQIAAVEGSAGREHTDPQLLISCGCTRIAGGSVRRAKLARAVRIRTRLPVAVRVAACKPSHFVGVSAPTTKTALDDLFTQVLGMLSAAGLITLERVRWTAPRLKLTRAATLSVVARKSRRI